MLRISPSFVSNLWLFSSFDSKSSATAPIQVLLKLKFDSLKKIVIVFQRLMRTKKSRGTIFYHFIEFN